MLVSCLFYKRIWLVGAAGFEPATTRTPSVCATRLRHAPTRHEEQTQSCEVPLMLRQYNRSSGLKTTSQFVLKRLSEVLSLRSVRPSDLKKYDTLVDYDFFRAAATR